MVVDPRDNPGRHLQPRRPVRCGQQRRGAREGAKIHLELSFDDVSTLKSRK
jgi:hypothetical protein